MVFYVRLEEDQIDALTDLISAEIVRLEWLMDRSAFVLDDMMDLINFHKSILGSLEARQQLQGKGSNNGR